jgi:hypothetical protein
MNGGVSGNNKRKVHGWLPPVQHQTEPQQPNQPHGGVSGGTTTTTHQQWWRSLLGGTITTSARRSLWHYQVLGRRGSKQLNGGLSGTKQQDCTEESPAPTLLKHKHTVGIHRCKGNGSHGGVSGNCNNEHPVGIHHRCDSTKLQECTEGSPALGTIHYKQMPTRRSLRWKNDPVLQEWVH